MSTMWQAAIKNLDVPQVRLHDARHTAWLGGMFRAAVLALAEVRWPGGLRSTAPSLAELVSARDT